MIFQIPETPRGHPFTVTIDSGGGGGAGRSPSSGITAASNFIVGSPHAYSGVRSSFAVVKVLYITDSMHEFGIREASFNSQEGTVDLNIAHAGRSIWHSDDLCATFSAKAWAQDILYQIGYCAPKLATSYPADNLALLLLDEEE